MNATRPCPWSLSDAVSPEFLAEQPVRAIAATAAPTASVRSIGDGLFIAGASWASGENERFRTLGGAATCTPWSRRSRGGLVADCSPDPAGGPDLFWSEPLARYAVSRHCFSGPDGLDHSVG